MSGRPSPDALDAELTHRVEEQARIADALLELERHPGLRLLATAALTGVTASRWVAARGFSRSCGPTSRRTAPSSPMPAPSAPAVHGRASASGRSCTSCSW